jgi:hypothetical protein
MVRESIEREVANAVAKQGDGAMGGKFLSQSRNAHETGRTGEKRGASSY